MSEKKISKIRHNKGFNEKPDLESLKIESNENLAFIAGYTSNGSSFSLTKEQYLLKAWTYLCKTKK